MKVASGAPAMELFNRRRFSTCMAIFQTCLAVAHLLLLKSSMLQLKPNIYLKVSNPDLHIHWIPFIGNLLLKYIFQIWIISTVKCASWLMRFCTRIILIKSGDLFIFNDLSSIIYLTIILQIRSSSCNAQGWQFVQCKFQCDPGCPTILLKFLLNFYCKEIHMLNTSFSLPKLCWNKALWLVENSSVTRKLELPIRVLYFSIS